MPHPLSSPATAALSLCIAKCYETGDWASSAASNEILSLGSEMPNDACFTATRWVEAALPVDAVQP